MDVRYFVTESATFTRATLAGKWSRWLILVLLGLPWMLLSSLAESKKILEGTTIHWNSIPWQEAGLLVCAGILCNIFISGYIVRLLQGESVPPEFDNWTRLCLDGIKVHIIPLIWILVPSILALIQYTIASGGLLPGNLWGTTLGFILILIILVIQLVILFIAVQYIIIGAIRYARTGSVREAFAVLAIRATLSRIGIVNYFVALGIITFVWLVFSLGLHVLSLVPYIGGIIALGLWPTMAVFCVRFMAHYCDEELLPAGREPGVAGGVYMPVRMSARNMIVEILSWLFILAVLFVLCFTPLALVIGSISGFFW
ncbi:MAG: DUF4013 domain-containing protein [Methanoregula sp.]|jgi:hypothetical protein